MTAGFFKSILYSLPLNPKGPQTEARLKKMGIAIDEDYQDPPIKALE